MLVCVCVCVCVYDSFRDWGMLLTSIESRVMFMNEIYSPVQMGVSVGT